MNRQRNLFYYYKYWRLQFRKKHVDVGRNGTKFQNLCSHLGVSENLAEHICIKYPVVQKLDEDHLKTLVQTVCNLGFSKEVLIEEPQLIGILPITLCFRHQVLTECGFYNVTPKLILSYLTVMKQEKIGVLKQKGLLPPLINVENRLASYMTQWPTSLTSAVLEDINKLTLYSLRLQIIQKYLQLLLDVSEIEFSRGIVTYPTLKHRPLAVMNETLSILQSQIRMPSQKIKSNLYLVHTDPNNLKNILNKFRSIGGVDIKEVIKMHPKIATKNYEMLIATKKVLKEYKITNEAQIRCFEIYTLNSNTVRERLKKAQSIPEFKTFANHPRYLKMIHYNNTAIKRLQKLYMNNKKCLSLNILSGSSAHYEVFEKAPGDRLGKGKDLIFCIKQSLGGKFKSTDIHKNLKIHPFWINIPLVQVKYVYEKLAQDFTCTDIFDNCAILLYPWSKVKEVIHMQNNNKVFIHEALDLTQLSKSQKLSLVLYALEKDHYFSGNGVWTEEKNKNICC